MDGNGDALVQALGLSYRRPSRGDAVDPTAPAELRPLAAPWRGQPDILVGVRQLVASCAQAGLPG
jgi:hypothetical protein